MNKFLLLFCLFFVGIGFSQTKTTVALQEFINQTEAKFSVKFSYAVEDIKDVTIPMPKSDLSLSETIVFLNKNTLLKFESLDDRYITVTQLNKLISVCGQVVVKATGVPLYGANIAVASQNIGAISGADGRFNLKDLPVDGTLVISYLGFKTQQYAIQDFFQSETDCKTIYLEESTESLNEILITKFLTTGLERSIDGSTILNSEAFGVLPGLTEPDVLQSIQVLPGVESVDESIANINVRGGTNDQNLILWDGIKMFHSGHFFGLISAYNPNLTNKVKVSKNGTSASYSDGVSSTINILTKDKVEDSVKGGFGLNLISADAYLEIPVSEKVAFHISGRRSFTDILTTPTFDNYFERSFQDSDINTNSQLSANSSATSDFSFFDYSAKLLYDINDRHQLRATGINIKNNLDYSEQVTNNDNTTTTKASNLQQNNLGAGLQWRAKWTDKWSSKVNAYYSNYTVDATDNRVESDQTVTQVNDVLDTGLKLEAVYKQSDHLNILMGYQLNETGILNETTVRNPDFFRTKKDVLINHSLFSEGEYKKDNTYLRLGLRGNYFQKFDTFLIEPRLNFRQQLSEVIGLKFMGEFKNQSATQIIDFQDDFLGVENRRWILADNSQIPIATSKQASLGVDYNFKNLVIDVTAFYKTVDGITTTNQGFYNNFQFINATGSYTAKGLEFLANKTADAYSAYVSYTYSVNDYTFEVFNPRQFPNNADIRHSVTLGFNVDILDNLKIASGATWRSGRPYTIPVEGNETVQNGNNTFVNYDSPNAENLDDFFRVDASLRYEFNTFKSVEGSLQAGILNLTNQKNVITRYYEVDPNDSNRAIEIENTSLGLTPNLSLRLRF